MKIIKLTGIDTIDVIRKYTEWLNENPDIKIEPKNVTYNFEWSRYEAAIITVMYKE